MTLYTHVPEATRGPAPSAYPASLATRVRLADGRELTLRPIRPGDIQAEWDFVHRLSPDSRYFRFMAPVKELTRDMLRRFTEIDYTREMALVAMAETPQGARQVGVARYSMLPESRSCEFAIVVDDEWRGTGLARALMDALVKVAREHHHLETMTGVTLAENRRMVGLAKSLGFDVRMDPEDAHLVLMQRDLRG
ncbi:MAG TPA: GNAT family N-acetyltransferase, partial [Steroidobacteraceae bacterium]|nr:GNAT family N-acetyltransferase [Steroidobacteraceae bacterium]